MLHRDRVVRVTPVESRDALVRTLSEHSWTLCSAFSFGGLVFANDATSEDGVAEWAVYRGDRQIESLTVSWMDADRFGLIVDHLLDGGGVASSAAPLRIDHPTGSCELCA